VRALLDAHAVLWWGADEARLSPIARSVITDGSNDLFVSAASIWELAIKHHKGDLDLPDEIGAFVDERLRRNRWLSLPIEQRHVLRAASLPSIHRDPFDRMLIAQSQIEGLPIVTVDPVIGRYDVETIW
jgi:PIN domain nuclease of toxin-antitoxin system